MAEIGSFGSSIIFQTSDSKILSFNNFKRTVQSKWAEHSGIGTTPASEYVGPGLDTISLEIVLCANLGVNPRNVIEEIENLCRNGSTDYLVIGNKRVGSGQYYISSVSESWDTIFAHGELYQATLSLTFNEYGR